MGNDVLCQVCRGVVPASEREAYTTSRSRLILSNGYCPGGCAQEQAAAPVQAPQAQVSSAALPVRPVARAR
jgi:hypothetical protein